MTQHILALDLGTTGNRAIAFTRSGQVAASAYYEFSQSFPNSAWVEHDPLEILNTLQQAITDVVQQIGAQAIACIGITNQRETIVVWDKASGLPLYPAIVWQCRRSESICEARREHTAEIRQKTGLFCDPYFSASKLTWLFENVPAVKACHQKGTLLAGTIDSWVLWNLSKDSVHATDTSNASRTLLYNIHTHQYDQDLLSLFGVPKDILPQVHQSQHFFGLSKASVLGKEVPITGILGDQQAALFGQGGWETGVLKNTYGTGLFLNTSTGKETPEIGKLLNTIAWSINGETNYALEGSVFVGGSAIQWLRDGLKIIDSAEESEALARSLPTNENVYFVPAFVGLGAPHWDAGARGLFIGLTRGTQRAHFVRAALEAMAYQSLDIVTELLAHNLTFQTLRVDGGASKNAFLMQFQSDILQLPVERPKLLETTAFGVAGMAGIGHGIWTLDTFAKARESDAVYHPQMNPKERDTLYTRWQNAVTRCLRYV